jgi:hypothetical protein
MVLATNTLAFTLSVDEGATFVSEMTSIRERVAHLPVGQDRVVMHQLEQFGKRPYDPALQDFPALVHHGFLRPNEDDPIKLEPYTPHLRRFASVGIRSSFASGYALLSREELQAKIQILRFHAQE